MTLAVRPTLLARVALWAERALGVGLPAYSRGGGGVPAQPEYDVDRSMSALVRSPWVWACVEAIATDLSGLPIVVERGAGIERKQTSTHWLIDLLDRPSPQVGGRRFRRQLLCDLLLSGNAYVRVWRSNGRPVRLGRIVPQLVQAQVGLDGEIVGWTLTATGERLTADEVLHIAGLSWTATQALALGESPIRPLHLALQVERDARIQAGRAARRGRIEMMLTPAAPEVVIGPDQVDDMVRHYAESAGRGDGVYVANKHMTAMPLSLSARDGEFLGISDRNRAEVLAVFGVPPTRVNEPAANYGTAKQQMRTYWEGLQGRAALLDDELSRLAEPGTRVRHSFAGVEALQTSQTERQARAVVWRESFGMDAEDAAAYEGFYDAPVSEAAIAARAPAPGRPPENGADGADPAVDEPREQAAVGSVLRQVAGLYAAGEDPADVERVARTLLRSALRSLGSPAADDVADEAAAVCREAAAAVLDGDASEVAAFGRDHAARIVRLARCT
jgi:HK97 family phage portal protein